MASPPDTFNKLTRSTGKSWYTSLVRAVGYGLLLLVLFDLVAMLISPRFMNPSWEFQVFGELVEKVAVPLIAIVLVFFGEEQSRGKFERIFLKGLSWLCLLAGVVLILLIPVTLSNVERLDVQADDVFLAQYNQQLNQAKQLEQQLKKATDDEVKRILQSQGQSLANQSPQQAKNQLLAQLTKAKQKLSADYEAKRVEQHLTLLKNRNKWCVGALVSGILFIYVWWLTSRPQEIQKPQ
ncbi:MAG: HpsJ family protein [Gloeobacterales cyanobacterium]